MVYNVMRVCHVEELRSKQFINSEMKAKNFRIGNPVKYDNRVIIAGSRGVEYSLEIQEKVSYYLSALDFKNTEIVSGTARGADRVGEKIAEKLGLPIKRFPADWDKYGKSAGYIRNKEMAEYGSHLILIWDGQSKGSKNMLEESQRRGLDIRVIEYKTDYK